MQRGGRFAGALSPSAGVLPASILSPSVSIGAVLSSPHDCPAHLAATETSRRYIFIIKTPTIALRRCYSGCAVREYSEVRHKNKEEKIECLVGTPLYAASSENSRLLLHTQWKQLQVALPERSGKGFIRGGRNRVGQGVPICSSFRKDASNADVCHEYSPFFLL